ncbi:unnamed protein product [Enterobius vermicularis]|uniref:Histidine kinase n=1 Tax=Enterobius vermicularis TaxID=51028 RepID=A0A0N4VB89_ENTVE|nr:unnamed protein product [Enterobius vermicularis]
MPDIKKSSCQSRQPLLLGRSLSSMKDDVQSTAFRIQQLLADSSMLAGQLATLKTLLMMNDRVELSLQLLLEPSPGELSVNEKILNGDLSGAYHR